MSRLLRARGLPVSSELLRPEADQFDVLAGWVAEVASLTDSLLEIGAGDGDDAYFPLIRPLVGRVVGVDPDPNASGHGGLDVLHQMPIESFAAQFSADRANREPKASATDHLRSLSATGSEPFDLALAIYVVEHVTKSAAFFAAARSCLRPGGSLFVITPNLWHYFGLLAKASMLLGIEDRLLGALRSARPALVHDRGQDQRHGHGHSGHGHSGHGHSGHAHEHGHGHAAHFPVAYRANSVRALRKVGDEAGFSRLEIRHLDNPAVFETYFPGRSVAFPRWYSRSVHRIGRPELFGTLICRFVN